MGSKGLKYISVDPGKSGVRQPTNKKEFNARSKTYTKDYLAGPQMFKTGTSSVVPVANMLFTFPYKNRTEGQSPDAATLDGARIVESFEERGGGMHNCMTGCIVKCSNVVHDRDGNYKTSALEFETLTLLGANCGIASWEDVAGSRSPVRRGRPRHGRDRRRHRHLHGLGRDGVRRRRGREAHPAGDRGRHRASVRRSVTAPSRPARRRVTRACRWPRARRCRPGIRGR